MRLIGNHNFLSIGKFDEIELPDFTIIIGLNGAGKSHFLQAIAGGAVHCDALGAIGQPLPPIAPPPAGQVPGVRLLRNDDPSPEGLTVGLKTEPNELFQPGAALTRHTQLNLSVLANLRQQLLAPMQDRLQEALGGSLDQIASPPRLALRMPLKALLAAARKKDWVVNEDSVIQLFHEASDKAETVSAGDPMFIQQARRLAAKSNQPFIGLGEDELARAESWGSYGLFDTHFVKVFLEYRNRRIVNAFRRVAGGDQARQALTDSEFEARWGGPPWERVSEVLSGFGLPYRVQEPSNDPHQPVYFRLERLDGVGVEFGNLSSGEKVLIRFALSAFQVDEDRLNVSVPKLLLLDEVDAALHPENVHRLLGVIQAGFVESMSVSVIMSTHSPSTVALSPEGAIFEMTEEDRVPRPITKQQALNRLTVGLPTLSIDYSGRRQVFVESSVDASQYDRLANHLKALLDLPRTLTFISAGGSAGGDSRGGCTVVTRIVKSLTESGVQSLFGVVDWDGTNDPDGPVKVLAHRSHYAKENVLLDPLLVAILLLLDKPGAVDFPMSLPQVDGADASDLQLLSNVVLQRLALPEDAATNYYLGGFNLAVPKQYQQMRGHDLEEKLVAAFPSLNKFAGSGKWLSDPIIDRVLSDFPRFCPMPIADIFREIATALPN
jgi:hypothetical protein